MKTPLNSSQNNHTNKLIRLRNECPYVLIIIKFYSSLHFLIYFLGLGFAILFLLIFLLFLFLLSPRLGWPTVEGSWAELGIRAKHI